LFGQQIGLYVGIAQVAKFDAHCGHVYRFKATGKADHRQRRLKHHGLPAHTL
jgi:hypothetical protein